MLTYLGSAFSRAQPEAAKMPRQPTWDEGRMESAENLHFEIEAHDAPVADAARAALIADPGFGKVFTDHMVTIRYSADRGWYDARIHARRPLMLDPACAVLHYAQEIFEGL